MESILLLLLLLLLLLYLTFEHTTLVPRFHIAYVRGLLPEPPGWRSISQGIICFFKISGSKIPEILYNASLPAYPTTLFKYLYLSSVPLFS